MKHDRHEEHTMEPLDLKHALGREAERIDPGPAPVARIEARVRRRRLVMVSGVVVAAAVVTTASVLQLSGGGGSAGAGPQATSNVSRTPAAASENGAPGPVVATMNTEAALKQYYPKIADLVASKAVDAIVEGRISRVEFTTVEGLPMTVLTVDVSNHLYGATGATVTVNEDGGYLPAADMIAELKAKNPAAQPTVDPHGYVDVRFEGAAHPQAGDSVVLFLMKDPNQGREGQFMEVSSVYGRFTASGAGVYVRTGHGDVIETSVPARGLRDLVTRTRGR